MKLLTSFKLDIRIKKLLKILSAQLGLRETTIVEKAITEFALKHGIEIDFCPFMVKIEDYKVYCGKAGMWKEVKFCLRCTSWKHKPTITIGD